jgi:hypothetical protein
MCGIPSGWLADIHAGHDLLPGTYKFPLSDGESDTLDTIVVSALNRIHWNEPHTECAQLLFFFLEFPSA